MLTRRSCISLDSVSPRRQRETSTERKTVAPIGQALYLGIIDVPIDDGDVREDIYSNERTAFNAGTVGQADDPFQIFCSMNSVCIQICYSVNLGFFILL